MEEDRGNVSLDWRDGGLSVFDAVSIELETCPNDVEGDTKKVGIELLCVSGVFHDNDESNEDDNSPEDL